MGQKQMDLCRPLRSNVPPRSSRSGSKRAGFPCNVSPLRLGQSLCPWEYNAIVRSHKEYALTARDNSSTSLTNMGSIRTAPRATPGIISDCSAPPTSTRLFPMVATPSPSTGHNFPSARYRGFSWTYWSTVPGLARRMRPCR